MLRCCATHRDTSENWKFRLLQKFEWSGWQNATNYATENRDFPLHWLTEVAEVQWTVHWTLAEIRSSVYSAVDTC
jgi:hypothetical protein